MRGYPRLTKYIGLSAYILILLVQMVDSAQAASQAAGQPGFATWFWTQVRWSDFGTAAFVSLIGGAVRTAITLRSQEPTVRVLVEGIGDAVISFLVGGAAFLGLMVWQVFYGPTDLWVVAGVCFMCGLLRGWVLTWLEDTAKRMLAASADAFVTGAATAAGAIANKFAAIAAARAASSETPKEPPA
ncbi:MAG: hypothetical protein V4718_04575 [Pseudomonadota bacterium]